MRIINVQDSKDIKKIMQDIWVDSAGIQIMTPKSLGFLIRINSLSNISANILKQEMLSLGGDVAVARGALTGKSKKTDCLLMGNLSQINRLNEKLSKQPFGLNNLAKDISFNLGNYQKDKFLVNLGRFKLSLGSKTKIMGVINLTPDSFSGDGLYHLPEQALARAKQMVKDGADIIDIGGQSSRPGSKPVSTKEELKRILPVVKKLAKEVKVPVSIDTYRPEVAKAALDYGASIINDITGLKNPKMRKLAAKHKCGVVIMHMRGTPRTMQNSPAYDNVIDQIIAHFEQAISLAVDAGVSREKIIVDPGIGFGKRLEDNLSILKALKDFKVLGRPILVGVSRKSFIGTILNASVDNRLFGTISASVLAAQNGANIIRAHDVAQLKQAMKVSDAIINQKTC